MHEVHAPQLDMVCLKLHGVSDQLSQAYSLVTAWLPFRLGEFDCYKRQNAYAWQCCRSGEYGACAEYSSTVWW